MLSRDKYAVLIAVNPRWSIATYFDSGSSVIEKDYTRIKSVLDEALEIYARNGGTFEKNCEFFNKNKTHKFRHVTNFPCIKEDSESVKEGFYVIHQLKGYVEEADAMRFPNKLREWTKNMGEISDADLREDFHRTQMKLSHIILQDVMATAGPLHYPRGRMYYKTAPS